MANRNGMGPGNQGPMTGRGMGSCGNGTGTGFFGRGFGKGMGCGRGRGRGNGMGFGLGGNADNQGGLKQYAAQLEAELANIKGMLKD